MQSRHGMRRWIVAGALGFSIAPAASARALSNAPRTGVGLVAIDEPVCASRVTVTDRSSQWAAPLDRIVSVRMPDAALRDALDRVAGLSKVELSYSNELLPPGRRVCLTLDRVPVGAVLETLLAGTTLRAIVVGSTQVVLAPSRPVASGLSIAPLIRRASVLDRVVVTGTPDGAPQRGSPFALEVIDGATLARQRATSLGEALDLAVPGVWTWSSTAGTLSARYGSIRGASSFGTSAPKVYLDGIEVANPLLVTQLDPARVERVEVIRGPQGAALYGADAISGVVNILTRHDGTASGNTSIQLSSVAGVAATDYAPRDAFVQEHAIALRGGGSRRTFGLGLNVGTVGAYLPGASERRVLADGDVRFVLSRAVLTGTGRLSLQKANASTGFVFGGAAPSFETTARANSVVARPPGPSDSVAVRRPAIDSTGVAGDSATGQDMTQYTLGGTATMMPSLRWTNTVIVGIDGYRMQGLSTAGLPMPSTFGSALVDGQGGADRGTLRLRAVGRYDLSPRTMLALTFAGEQAFTRELIDGEGLTQVARVNLGFGSSAQAFARGATPQALVTRWGNSGGLTAQANLAWRDQLYLVAGGRAERTVGFTDTPQNALLPMLGVAYVGDVNGVVVKLRSAYGTGIRPASSIARGATWMGRVVNASATSLQPESQTGIEAGIDALFSRALSLHVTRFDQRASGLIQPVAGTSTYATANGALVRRMSYTLENIGAITNRGWELQARSTVNRLMLAGSMTVVDSRVDQLARLYGGDLRVGDRMLDVPARTYSLSATWVASRWSASAMMTRAEDWIGYDRVGVGAALSDTSREQPLNGRQLRSFWLNYGGVTRLRGNISYRLVREWSVLLGGDNLLNVQRGAPDNATVTAGRTLTLGFRAGY
ncbi:MAG: TonB-dependent receptor [Gemmatimonadaceae bacterium]|nr:TonB-dependent receptor [Gemmatimonadaceae bacterium]